MVCLASAERAASFRTLNERRHDRSIRGLLALADDHDHSFCLVTRVELALALNWVQSKLG